MLKPEAAADSLCEYTDLYTRGDQSIIQTETLFRIKGAAISNYSETASINREFS